MNQLVKTGMPRTQPGKLRPPIIHGPAVTRTRLFDSLNKSLMSDANTFVMVTAPAGFGKTYLLAQWVTHLRESGTIAAWCALDDDERDPAELRVTIARALVEATRSRDGRAHPEFERLASIAEETGHGEFFTALAEIIDATGRRIELIVDDAHVLLGSAGEEEFIRLLRWAPANLHVSFATRSPLSTQTARVSGRLVELSADSLSFTRAETTELFSSYDITPEGLERLFASAEGWPAALSLAILNVEADDPAAIALPDAGLLSPFPMPGCFTTTCGTRCTPTSRTRSGQFCKWRLSPLR